MEKRKEEKKEAHLRGAKAFARNLPGFFSVYDLHSRLQQRGKQVSCAESGSRRSAVSQEIRQWDWQPRDQTMEVPKPEKQKMHKGGQ